MALRGGEHQFTQSTLHPIEFGHRRYFPHTNAHSQPKLGRCQIVRPTAIPSDTKALPRTPFAWLEAERAIHECPWRSRKGPMQNWLNNIKQLAIRQPGTPSPSALHQVEPSEAGCIHNLHHGFKQMRPHRKKQTDTAAIFPLTHSSRTRVESKCPWASVGRPLLRP